MCRCCGAPMRSGASSSRPAGRQLLHVTGIVEIGPPDGVVVPGTLAAREPAFAAARGSGGAGTDAAVSRLPAAAALRRRGAAGRRLPGSRAGGPCAGSAGEGVRAPRSAPARPCARSSRMRSGVRIVSDRGTIEAGAVDRRRRAVDENAAARSAGAAAGDAAGDGLVRAGRAGAGRAGTLSGIPAGERTRHPLRHPAVRGRRSSRSPSITIATRLSIPTPTTDTVSADDEALIRAALAEHLPAANGPLAAAADLPLHDDARRRFPHRPPARLAAGDRRLALLRPRLQVCAGDRRNPRRPCDRRARPRTTSRASVSARG